MNGMCHFGVNGRPIRHILHRFKMYRHRVNVVLINPRQLHLIKSNIIKGPLKIDQKSNNALDEAEKSSYV